MEYTIKTEVYRYQCKYCSVIYEDRDNFIQHKRQDHLQEVLRDLKKKSQKKISITNSNNAQSDEVLEIPEGSTTMTIENADVKPLYTSTEKVTEIQEPGMDGTINRNPGINISSTQTVEFTTTNLDIDGTDNCSPGLKTSTTQTIEFLSTESDMDGIENGNTGLKTSSTETVESTTAGARILSCSKCPFTTLNRTLLHHHFNNHILKTSVPCPICSIQCANSFGVRIHVIRSHSAKNAQNKAKLEAFFQRNPTTKYANDKIEHTKFGKMNDHGVATKPVIVIIKKLKEKYYIKPPKNSKCENDFKCNICTKSFLTRKKLSDHKFIHKKTKECPYCNKRFPFNSSVNTHIKSNHPNQPLLVSQFQFIKKILKNKNHLLKCSFCTKSFSTQKGLQVHKMYHNKLKHKCPYCNLKFSFNMINRHIKIKHINP